LDRSLFGFILRYSKRDQLLIVPLVFASMAVYYLSLDLPKTIINEPIQGGRFPNPDSTAPFLRIVFTLPELLGGGTIHLFDGIPLEQLPYLFALTFTFLTLIVLNGFIRFQINTMKGWMGERMLRRLRYVLFDHVLRFPLPRFRRVKSAEVAGMIKDEVEPLGGFIGEAYITPLALGGEALTALFFILYQHFALGLIAFGMVTVQAVVIPRLRRRLLALAKQRQLSARQLAGRIAESVDGIVEIRANDTSNYERAEISSRLGRIFRIRFEFYQRKFLIKFLNNLLSQLTPFLFYSVGGYLVIVGRLDLGALVAVIAAYKDLPSPIKELIDWDQQRLDVQIKYTQVIEQFLVDDLLPPEMQQVVDAPQLPAEGTLRAMNLSLVDESGEKVVDAVTFEVGLESHVAVVGQPGAGGSELAQLLARLVPPSAGTVEMGGVDITRAPEAVTGRAISYVGSSAYLFPSSVRENLLYGLKHRPVGEATYEGAALRDVEFEQRESKRTGGCLLDYQADWVDYRAAGAANADEMEGKIHAVLKTLELEEHIFELGLRSAVEPAKAQGLRDKLLGARAAMHDRLAGADMQEWVEPFDPSRYNRNATLAENLLFGAPVGKVFDVENLARNAYVRRVLEETALVGDLVRIGYKVAETMIELFSGLPPGHEFFEQYSFIRHEDLPLYKEILARAVESDLGSLTEADRDQLLALPFKLIQARHRLGLIDEALEGRIVEARRYFAAHLPVNLKGAVEFFDPLRYNLAASLQDNILFGKIVLSHAQAASRVGSLLRQVLDDLGLRPLVVGIGLDYQVGVGGARLAVAERQKVALARALLKRPAVLILDRAAAVLDPATQVRVLTGILQYRKGQCVLWVLENNDLAERFEHVLVMERGRLSERGSVAELRSRGGALQMLLAASGG
jgi:putative ABC transport system ATP-binding protein